MPRARKPRKTGLCAKCYTSTEAKKHLPFAINGQRGANNPSWKGDRLVNADVMARRLHPLDGIECEDCEELATDVHHIDGNNRNNQKFNIAFLCHSCHMKRHWKDLKWRANQVAKEEGEVQCQPVR